MERKLKNIYAVSLTLILILALIYVSSITNIPDTLVLMEGEELRLKTFFGINIESEVSNKPEVIEVSANENMKNTKVSYELSLFGVKLKEINAYVIEQREVVPLRKFNWLKALYKWRFSCWYV